jgi:hypothetical protein
MTSAQLAREIERRRPGTVPKSSYFVCDGSLAVCDENGRRAGIPDDIAAAVIRDAMVMALASRGGVSRFDEFGVWECCVDYSMVDALDADHDGEPNRSLFALFCEVFP